MVGFPYSGADVIELKWRLGRPSQRLLAGFVSRTLVCNLAFACQCTMKESQYTANKAPKPTVMLTQISGTFCTC